MQNTRSSIFKPLALFLIFLILPNICFSSSRISGKVTWIYDGDTVKIKTDNSNKKIRLAFIDAPEMGYNDSKGQPFAKKSKYFLFHLIHNKQVTLSCYGKDTYGRSLCEIYLDHKSINLLMIQSGMAEIYKGKKGNTKDLSFYYRTELEAQKTKTGIWSQGDKYRSPRLYRKNYHSQ